MIWLQVLFFLKNLTEQVADSEPTIISTIVAFINRHFDRFVKVLSFQGYYNEQYHDDVNVYSLAHIEEIDYMTGLIMTVFERADEWKNQSEDQYYYLINILTKNTIKLYMANVSLRESFIPVSAHE